MPNEKQQSDSSSALPVSIIIPAYNAADTIAAQLNALKAQSYGGAWEVIVVDNGSTDATVGVVQGYEREMPNLRLISALARKNTGYARNMGVKAAKGDAFLFCDADDVVAPGWLSALAAVVKRHDLVVGLVEVHKLKPDAPQKYDNNGMNDPSYNFLPFAIGCNCAVSRRAFESVGGYLGRYPRCEDIDLSWRLQIAGYSLYEEPAAVLHYRLRNNARSLWKAVFRFSQTDVLLYKDYAPYGARRPSWEQSWLRYKAVVKEIPWLWRKNKRERIAWAQEAAVICGRLWGSLRYRTLYL